MLLPSFKFLNGLNNSTEEKACQAIFLFAVLQLSFLNLLVSGSLF